MRKTLALSFVLVAGCTHELNTEGGVAAAGAFEELEDKWALSRTCSDGPTVPGIDVSKWQATIDWDAVAADGIEYAFIRVSDGTANIDNKFARNWAEARRVGIRRGAYQFFRPNRDPIAQADILIDMMGTLLPGDLPPVLDLEAASGMSRAQVASRARQWLDRVEAATGVKPIVYTGPYFWRDAVGGPAWGVDHRLWVAHYTSGCPLTPSPWGAWTFHQYTDSGRVDGVPGNVDRNYFNGTLAQLDALTVDGTPPPPPPACELIGAAGGTLEEDSACGELGGPTQYLRAESGGSGGGYIWTGAISGDPTNYAEWSLNLAAAGAYRVEVYLPAGAGTTRTARYEVQHSGGEDEIVVDQSAASGWVSLGEFFFSQGMGYRVRLTDNTGEPSSTQRRIVFDAVRVIPADNAVPPPADPPPAAEVCADIDDGAVLEEDGPCTVLSGPAEYLRAELGAGSGGGYVWTGATASGTTHNSAKWALPFTVPGRYRVEAYVAPGAATTTRARYFVTHGDGTDSVNIDQSAAGGYVELGIFTFGTANGQKVFLGDNTGEASDLGRRIVLDAIRVTPADDAPCAQVRVNAGVNLNVRPTPSTSQASIGQLNGSAVVDRIATVDGQSISGDTTWYRVSFSGQAGYISGRFAGCW
jgi:GH25 family lysozyme M1 (1,4-beta-N-acetylmuramidase)